MCWLLRRLSGPEDSAKSRTAFKSGPVGIRESSKDNEEEEVCRLEQTPQCSVSPLLDNALGSPHFKTESWTNIKRGSECKNHSGLGL